MAKTPIFEKKESKKEEKRESKMPPWMHKSMEKKEGAHAKTMKKGKKC